MKTHKPLRDRFFEKIEFGENDCWLWTAYKDRSGYARLTRPDGSPLAHRYAWEVIDGNGPVPAGMHLDHLCRVRHCVNPAHLELVTPQENFARGNSPQAINRRKSHCDHGHELSGENVKVVEKVVTYRVCVTCARRRKRAYKHQRHAEGIAA